MNETNAHDADAAEAAARTPHRSGTQLASGMLAIFALVAALYLARGFFIPLLIGILATYALHPLVDRLAALRVPRSVGAALVLAMVVGSISWVGLMVSDDTVVLVKKLPGAARDLRQGLYSARLGTPTALQNMQETAHELQGAATDAGMQPAATGGAQSGSGGRTPAKPMAAQALEPTWLPDYALEQSALLVTVAAQAPIVLLLSYFLLASGAHFRRKLVQFVGPSLSHKKDAVRILEKIEPLAKHRLHAVLFRGERRNKLEGAGRHFWHDEVSTPIS